MAVPLSIGKAVSYKTVIQFVAFRIKNIGLWGAHGFRFESLSFLVHQAIPQAVLGRYNAFQSFVALPLFDGFDVVDGPSLRRLMNGARMN